MTCVKCKVQQVDYLSFNGKLYPAHELAFCKRCRYYNFPYYVIPDSQYGNYWYLKSKPYVAARK